uniref:Cannabinoid receptor interacting protein 1b n=1 Tax=Cyprinus carpio carpio TaxID=630221 RepID=A0A9J8AMM6_CYPCA
MQLRVEAYPNITDEIALLRWCCDSNISDGGYTTKYILYLNFPLEQQSKDPQSVVFTGMYDTEGVAHTKSGEKQHTICDWKKTTDDTVYNKRDHCQRGNSFEYECKPNNTHTLMWISKELFL